MKDLFTNAKNFLKKNFTTIFIYLWTFGAGYKFREGDWFMFLFAIFMVIWNKQREEKANESKSALHD